MAYDSDGNWINTGEDDLESYGQEALAEYNPTSDISSDNWSGWSLPDDTTSTSSYSTKSVEDILNSGYPSATGSSSKTSSSGTTPSTSSGYTLKTANAVSKASLPTLSLPTYTAPEYDESRISALTQKAAASGLRKLRGQTQAAIVSSQSQTATARKMTLREALAGYGEGVSSVMGAASKTAQSQYGQEYASDYNESLMNYQTSVAQAQAEYQTELNRIYYNAKQGV
ncbi:MAG: hypothetical protein WC455_16455 [Dehalococcoidia bacterium]